MSFTKIINDYKDLFYYKTLESHLRDCSSVLDIGCGSDSPLLRLKKTFLSHGIDAHRPSITISKNKKIAIILPDLSVIGGQRYAL